MKIAVFGGTGFVGKYLLKSLIADNHEIYTLVRNGSEHKIQHLDNINIINGLITNNTSLTQTIMNCSVVIYNIGAIREFKSKGITYKKLHYDYAKLVIDQAKKCNIQHIILMSANGVKQDGTGYQNTKYMAEKYLKKSGLNYTIFRPSLIFGEPKNDQEFCTQLRDTMIRLPFPAPLFFSGFNIFKAAQFEMSPIHIKNVSEFFVKSIKNDKHYMKTYELGGLQSYNWKEIISIISAAVQKTKWMVPVPVDLIKILAFLFDRFKFFPITRDQIAMLLEGNTCQSRQLFNEFDITPIEFSIKNLSYLHQK